MKWIKVPKRSVKIIYIHFSFNQGSEWQGLKAVFLETRNEKFVKTAVTELYDIVITKLIGIFADKMGQASSE